MNTAAKTAAAGISFNHGRKLSCLGFISGAIVWVSIFRAEYGLCIVLLVFVFYVFETRNVLKTVLGCIISLMYVTGPIAFYGIWCCTGERKDYINKYVYYAFYPLHLLVLGVIANYIL